MKALSRTSSMTNLRGNHDNRKSRAIWSESILAQLESISLDNNVSSNYSFSSSLSENRSQQWKESTLAAGMMVEEKQPAQEEIASITPTSSEEPETASPSSISPSNSFHFHDKENMKPNMVDSSFKSTGVISKSEIEKKHKAKNGKSEDDDAQSVASNISRLRAKQKLLRLHSANRLAESRRRLSLQLQSTQGQQYLPTRDASSVTSRTTISEWSAMHHTPSHRRSSIPRQVLISESPSLHDLRQSPVHESKDTLTVATESERVLQERLSKVQDELAGTRQMVKFMIMILVLTAMGLIFHGELLQAVHHSRFGTSPLAPPALGRQMQSSTVGMGTLSMAETDCDNQDASCVNIDSGIITISPAQKGDEFMRKSQTNKKAILDRAQRILKSKANESSLDTSNPDYIALLLSQ